MNEEKSLVDIAIDASLKTRSDLGRDFHWSAIVSAVEKAVLTRLKKDEEEPVAGQELTIGQAAKIAEDNGSTDILEYFNDDLSRFVPCGYNNCIYLGSRYRVAPKKINDPDDPTTWEKGVAIFRRDSHTVAWALDTFNHYSDNTLYKYNAEHSVYKYAKLATPEQIEAWNKTQED